MDNEPQYFDGLEAAKEFIPPKFRRFLYASLSVFGYLLGAIAVGFTATGGDVPQALVVAMAVSGFLLGPIGQLAATNTTVSKPLYDVVESSEIADAVDE